MSDLRVYVLQSQPKGGLESLLCKETFVVVACGRVVQDRADFFLPVKTCLSTQAVHLFITRCSTSTVLSIGAVNFPFPLREFHRQCPTILCLVCNHLAWLLCSNLAQDRSRNRMWELDMYQVFASTVLLVLCQTLDYHAVVSEKVGLLLAALLINSSSSTNVSAHPRLDLQSFNSNP